MALADVADERVQQLNALASQSPSEPYTIEEPWLHPAAEEAMLEAEVRRLSPQERLRLEHQLGKAVTRINDLERTTLVICLTLVVLATLGFIYLLFFY